MRIRTSIAAGLAASALALTPLVAASAVPTDDADEGTDSDAVVVSSVDFDDETTGDWTRSGGPTLAVVAAPAGGAGLALSVSERTDTWDSLQSPAGLFAEGVTYTLSARVLVPDTAGESGQARFIVRDGYHWVANTPVPTGSWTTITGSFTADGDDSQVYLEVVPGSASFFVDDILITRPATGDGEEPGQQPGSLIVDATFDDGTLQGWFARQGSGSSAPVASVVTGGAEETPYAAQVSGRSHEGDGIQLDVTDVLLSGHSYQVDALVRFAPGSDTGRGLTISMRTATGGSAAYTNLLQAENVTATGWTRVSGEFTVPTYDAAAELYVEARYGSGNTATFLLDQLRVTVPESGVIDTDLVPLKDTTDFNVGIAIDSRETAGGAAELLLHHADQVTPENHMKVDAWYTGDGSFQRHAQASAILDFAQANDLDVYGHVLLWHSQTPDWFFQDDTGRDLTDTTADQQFLRDRLARHVDDVARSIYEDYGPYGSATNPITAWDVVNEVVSDQHTPDGLRTSRWYEILGEEYIHLAFELADEAFNHTYAAAGAERPVMLFINDYNTELDAKGARYLALVERLLAADVPLDGVGHQFHVSINTSISSLEAALDRFAGLGLRQEVTELDVTLNPADDANLIRQGYFYRDAFRLFRTYDAAAPAEEKLFAVTIWGLTDDRSWRASQAPLLFDADLQAKPAYHGAVDGELPAQLTTASVFSGDVALEPGFAEAIEWHNLPENVLTNGVGGFQARWEADHLTVLVRSTVDPQHIEFTYGEAEYVYQGGAASSVPGIETAVGAQHFVAVRLPHAGVSAGATGQLDVRIVADGAVAGSWSSPGETGTLTFLGELHYVEIPEALAPPTVDGRIDDVWQSAAVVTTATRVEGSAEGATAAVRTLWHGNTLYALYEVTDPVIDSSSSDPWNKDSIELFLDLENTRNGAYGPNDTQIRVTIDGDVSFGSGNAELQASRVRANAVELTETGYIVELAIDLIGQSGGAERRSARRPRHVPWD